MSRVRTVSALAIAALTTLGLALPASADPTLTSSLGSMPTEGSVGETFEILASGCVNPDGDAYFGGYIVDGSDPQQIMPGDLTTDGTWAHDVVLEGDPGTVVVHAFCATAPVTSPTDPNMLWVSPAYEFTQMEAPAGAAARSGGARSAGKVADAPAEALSVDADAVPLVDRMGMPGAQANRLKAKVDARFEEVALVSRLFQTFTGRLPNIGELRSWSAVQRRVPAATLAAQLAASNKIVAAHKKQTDAQFVRSTYENAFGRSPSEATTDAQVDRLADQTATRAQIALEFAESTELRAASDDAHFVVAAYVVITGGMPTSSQIANEVDKLQNTLTPRVQVVEDIALG